MNKEKTIAFRVSEIIQKKIKMKAKESGMSLSDFVRFLILREVEKSEGE